jgi:glycosyltransferase involved in cell wall biosynthesis
MEASISLVVPVHNPGPHLPALLKTVAGQQGIDEILLIDDASTDGAWDAICRHTDPRIRALRFETNKGSSAARNYGLDAASGGFVAMLDADDFYLLPNLLTRQRDFLLAHPDHIYVGSSFVKVKASGDFEQPFILAGHDTRIRWESLFSAPWLPSGAMMRRNKVRFDEAQRGCEDNDFFSGLLELGKGANLAEIGFGYFMLGGQSAKYRDSNFVNLLRTNQRNLEKIGVSADFEDILAIRKALAGQPATSADFSRIAIVFDAFRRQANLDANEVSDIERGIEAMQAQCK